MRSLRAVAVTIALLLGLFLLTFAIPVRVWRTGELPAPPLPVVEGGPIVRMPTRIWIDTDAACGHGRTTDPDDCFGLLLLARSNAVEIAGISTVYGNATLDVTDRTTRDLVAMLYRDRGRAPAVYRGSATPIGEDGSLAPQPAHEALRRALKEGPLTLIGLGPLTNVAAALRGRPALRANVARLVAVMGRRRGHLFHPAEGAGGGMLFGHGPVFRDFNFDQDRRAATLILDMQLPTTLIPYEAARGISLTERDLAHMEARGGAGAWVASRARGWLEFWRSEIGRDGFYPFDLLAAAYVIDPRLFDCARATAWVSKDPKLRRWRWFYDPDALLVGVPREVPDEVRAKSTGLYCPRVNAQPYPRLMEAL